MVINDLIFKELIKRGYSERNGKRIWNIADSKLWYLTPQQAQAYLDLERSKEYSHQMFDIEIDMLKNFMPEIAKIIFEKKKINVIDIGCGDGKKAVVPLEVVGKKTKLRYCPIDISSYMVTKAIEKIKFLNKAEVVEFNWNISDFDNLENVSSVLRDSNYSQNFFLFLGNTLGNFEIHEVLYEVDEAMKTGDYLLIGVALGDRKPEDITKSYKSDDLNDRFLRLILNQIGFGNKEISLNIEFNHSRIEAYYTISVDKDIKFGDRTLSFKKGDQILVAVSHRYTTEELKQHLEIYFKQMTIFTNKDKSWALVLCKK